MTINCPTCHKNPATIHPRLGVLPCDACKDRQNALPRPSKAIEITTDSIRRQRVEFDDDTEQPFRKGEPNKKYIEIYGEERAKQVGMTENEIKNAKYVYDNSDVRYYNDQT